MNESTELPRTPSVEPLHRSQLLPRYSFRAVIGITLFAALVLATARAANSGMVVAAGLLAGIVFLACCFLLFSVLFLFSWLVSIVWYEPDHETLHGSMHSTAPLPPSSLPRSDRL